VSEPAAPCPLGPRGSEPSAPNPVRFTIVTPSFNQGKYLEKTILSVLEQGYPNLEYIIIDGGSTDESVEIIRKYADRLTYWVSEPDRGQSHAINKGFERATGEIFGWLNSDDWYQPEVLHEVARFFKYNSDANIVMGDCNLVDEYGAIFSTVVNSERSFDEISKYWKGKAIPTQPALFIRSKIIIEIGPLDETLHYAMDYDLWLKASKNNKFHHINKTIANYRFHKDAKGGDQKWDNFYPEWRRVYSKHLHDIIPDISVVIPCYNYARYLESAVESVIRQTFQGFEIIIVNDGSPDNTMDVANNLIIRYPEYRISIISQINSGQPAISRNKGILSAKGRYILPLDADDMIESTMLEKCIGILDNNPEISIVYTDRCDFDGVDDIVVALDYDFSSLIYANHISYCALFKAEVWNIVGGYRTNVKGLEDWDFWIAAGILGFRGHRIPEPLFCYRRHDTGLYQEAIGNFDAKYAQIVINNFSAYTNKDIAIAETVLIDNYIACSQDNPLVSVIITTFNRKEMLSNAISSVLNQTYRNIEIIVVNDAGCDVSDVVSSFTSNKIKYTSHDENRGLSAARNTGITMSNGVYICYLDDDDIYHINHIDILIKEINNTSYDVGYTDAYRVEQRYNNGKIEEVSRELIYSYDFDYNRILKENFIPVLCVMHKKQCFEQVGYFDEKLKRMEDWDLWIRMSRQFRFKHINKVTCEYSYINDGSSMMSGPKAPFAWAALNMYHKYYYYVYAKPEIIEYFEHCIDGAVKTLLSIIYSAYNKDEIELLISESSIDDTLSRIDELIIKYHRNTNIILLKGAIEEKLNLNINKTLSELLSNAAHIKLITESNDQTASSIFCKLQHMGSTLDVTKNALNQALISLATANNLNDQLINSWSWRITAPLRYIAQSINSWIHK